MRVKQVMRRSCERRSAPLADALHKLLYTLRKICRKEDRLFDHGTPAAKKVHALERKSPICHNLKQLTHRHTKKMRRGVDSMVDPRLTKLADVLVNYSTAVQQGENVLIEAFGI